MSAITSLKDKLVDSTIDLYFSIQNSKELLPTPAKSHYTYNLRDISKVFQGISKSSNKAFERDNDFIKLWAHECMRVFKDRLINDQDQSFFDKMLKDLTTNNLKREWSDLVQIQPLLWSDFVPTICKSKDEPTKKIPNVYCELVNRDDLKKVSYEKLNEYNNFYSANKMNLVLFDSAISHVIKIVRMLTTTFGHGLLVGVGGSGRKSFATLATFIACDESEPQIVN